MENAMHMQQLPLSPVSEGLAQQGMSMSCLDQPACALLLQCSPQHDFAVHSQGQGLWSLGLFALRSPVHPQPSCHQFRPLVGRSPGPAPSNRSLSLHHYVGNVCDPIDQNVLSFKLGCKVLPWSAAKLTASCSQPSVMHPGACRFF